MKHGPPNIKYVNSERLLVRFPLKIWWADEWGLIKGGIIAVSLTGALRRAQGAAEKNISPSRLRAYRSLSENSRIGPC